MEGRDPVRVVAARDLKEWKDEARRGSSENASLRSEVQHRLGAPAHRPHAMQVRAR